nr:MAG: peptidase U61 [Bacteroidota bacterium]
MRKPPLLRSGDRIAITAPASPPPDLAQVEAGVRYWERNGFRVEVGPSVYRSWGYLAGADQERARELERFFLDPEVRAIVAVRGGYGSLRLLRYLDWDALAAHPKLLIGYSDLTALQWALWARLGLVSISGPMLASDWADPDPDTEAWFWDLIGGAPELEIRDEGLIPWRSGEAAGILLGGTLSLIVRLLGTPFWPRTAGTIWFLEDVGEPPYRIDGMLAQLLLSGHWEQIAGVLWGSFTESPLVSGPTFSMREVLEQYSVFVSGPVIFGLLYGHLRRRRSLPIGVPARVRVGPGGELWVRITSPVETR